WVDTPLPTPLVLLAGNTYRIMVHENGVEFYWSSDLPTTFQDGTINQSFWDYGDVFPTQGDDAHWYFVDLRYATDFVSVPVTPTATTNFSSGTWSGNLAVLQAATNVILQASVGPGHSGASNPFNVIGTPKLAIAGSSNSVVLSWPVTTPPYNVEQASTLPNWSPCAVTPILVGDHYTITIPRDAAQTYFRLRKP
ncbi:MAG TPA: hypothetical protein VFD66_01450, partial [Verrucomicrobiae bacterium]|nr:hypothetical protein [Verrucomicrobiae bacterium]